MSSYCINKLHWVTIYMHLKVLWKSAESIVLIVLTMFSYGTVNFIQNTPYKCPLACLWGWDMGCCLQLQSVIYLSHCCVLSKLCTASKWALCRLLACLQGSFCECAQPMKDNVTISLVKMAAISQMIFSNVFLWNEKFCIFIKISLKFVSKGPIENNPASIQIMAWCLIGNKPLSEPMLTWFTDAYIQH